MIEIDGVPLVDHIDHRAMFGFRFADRNWRCKVKPVQKLDTIHLEALVRPAKDLMAKIDPDPTICEMLAEELLSNPPPVLTKALQSLHRTCMRAAGLYVPPEPDVTRFDHDLIHKHPKIFPGGPRSADGHGWFFACGPGWSDLIDTLCSRIQQHVDGHKIEQVVAAHVKQKFGGLRFAYSSIHDDQRIAGMVEMACAMSLHICEICGGKATVFNDQGWVRVRCNAHHHTPVDSIDLPS